MDLIAIGLIVWSRFLARRANAPAWVRWLWLALIVVAVGSFIASLVLLKLAFTSVEGIAPQDKARVLADGISRAMFAAAVGLAFDAVCAVALGVYAWTGRVRA